MTPVGRLNRVAMLAILPVMALTVGLAAGALGHTGRAPAPATGRLVVANLRTETLAVHRLGEGSPPSLLALPGPPHELAFAGGRLYATLGRANTVVEVEPGAPGILRLLRLDGAPHGLAVAADGSVLVGLDIADLLVTVDRASFAEVARAPTGSIPHAVAAAGGETYVAGAGDGSLRLLGYPSPAAAGTGALPESVAVVGAYVVTADAGSGSVSVFARRTLAPLGRLVVGGHPVRVLALDDSRAAVALNDAATVAVVDVSRLRVVRRLVVDPHPDGLCLSPDGRSLAVVSNETGATQVFEVVSWRRTGNLAGEAGGGACAWLPGH
ncbi:MAG: hypothetical protein IT304_07790 [Dehalococcoidia bacterium]|nr:hypothetical protein [Dehalococcoidia bacterium]